MIFTRQNKPSRRGVAICLDLCPIRSGGQSKVKTGDSYLNGDKK